MTVEQLGAILAEMEPDAIVDVRVDGQPDGDWKVDGFAPINIISGPNKGGWLTLILEEPR